MIQMKLRMRDWEERRRGITPYIDTACTISEEELRIVLPDGRWVSVYMKGDELVVEALARFVDVPFRVALGRRQADITYPVKSATARPGVRE